jgi:class 3 adenylate cyclase/nitrite reductase/ring-hydroxylating ferredoxin subunit
VLRQRIGASAVVKVHSLPDDVTIELRPDEPLLTGALRSQVSFAHACGGRAKCSTCRIWVIDGLESCHQRNAAERELAERLGFDEHVRLACQLRPTDPIRIRRLVLDETDLRMCSQLDREVASRTGEVSNVTVFFSDVANFTELSAHLPAYDVMYLLNRYFVQVGDIVERNGGYIDKFMGDGMMAIFGVDGRVDAALRSVNAALQTLEAVDRMKPYFKSMYDIDFDIRIGLHYGEAVIGTLGAVGHERMTAIGDVVNLASRVEAANKEAGTRLLISDDLFGQVADKVDEVDFIRVRLPGTNERMTLHEIDNLTPAGKLELDLPETHDAMFFAGRSWTRLFPTDDLDDGAHRIVPFEDRDVVVLPAGDEFFAFNNACPHLHIPLFEPRPEIAEGSLGCYPGTDTPRPIHSAVTEGRGLVCRWHNSCFDLQTGEIREWVPRLENGMSPGWEFVGDMSKNPSRLMVYPCYIHQGYLWIALE